MTEQDFKNMMQTEIGALAAEGKSKTRLCAALKETLEWMGSTAFQYRKKHYTKKDEPEDAEEAKGTESETKEGETTAKGFWIRPDGATPKSYKWLCSVCGQEAHYAPSTKKGNEMKCGYTFCPFCGHPMEI